jgi:hypothetical protein
MLRSDFFRGIATMLDGAFVELLRFSGGGIDEIVYTCHLSTEHCRTVLGMDLPPDCDVEIRLHTARDYVAVMGVRAMVPANTVSMRVLRIDDREIHVGTSDDFGIVSPQKCVRIKLRSLCKIPVQVGLVVTGQPLIAVPAWLPFPVGSDSKPPELVMQGLSVTEIEIDSEDLDAEVQRLRDECVRDGTLPSSE